MNDEKIVIKKVNDKKEEKKEEPKEEPAEEKPKSKVYKTFGCNAETKQVEACAAFTTAEDCK